MAHFHFTYDPNVSLEQRLGFELASNIWSQFLFDDVTINLHIVATDSLNNGQAVGGAIPLFHEQNYGIYQEYIQQDATSVEDTTVIASQQDGNTVDVLIGDEVVDGNSTIMLTSAQAKALGMDEELQLTNGTHWNRDLVDSNALDGYILINNSFDWSYDVTRQNEVPENTLDFLTMALHEIGHALGFVSGLDGLLEVVELYSGETQAQGFTPLDLLRYTDASQALNNPDGQVADLTIGADAIFSLDGETNLATFSTGQDTTVGGDGYQASHWERFQDALGIMDPTLGYQERTDISHLDLQAFDVLGWDINYSVLDQGLDLQSLYNQALQAVSSDFGVDSQSLEQVIANNGNSYTLGYSQWWQAFADHMVTLGYSSWWQEFEAAVLELGYSSWWQALEQPMQELGYSQWWQAFEELVFDLGYSQWWQNFEGDMLGLGYSSWWQGFEAEQMLSLGYSSWWQDFENHMAALGYSSWWQDFKTDVLELGYSHWWQALETPLMELGYSQWWQALEDLVLELGYSHWWQGFENDMLELGYSHWWQGFEGELIELGYSHWWQQSNTFFASLNEMLNRDGILQFTKTLKKGYAKRGVMHGGNDDDIIGGTSVQDRIKGQAGDDLIDGAEGDDVIWGNGGRDILYGQDGADVVYGGADDDLVLGEQGNDQLFGETGSDVLVGGAGHDGISGGSGRDELSGGDGLDVIAGGEGDDLVDGEGDDDLIMGNEGQDRLSGGQGNDVIYGDQTLAKSQKGLAALLQQFLKRRANPHSSDRDLTPGLSTPTDNNGVIRIEAETMDLLGQYRIEASRSASGERRIKNRSRRRSGTAQTVFDGPAGRYMVIANYLDESDGQATAKVIINGEVLDTWAFTQDDNQYHTRTVTTDITLNPGDTIEIRGTRGRGEFARFDYLELVSLENLFPTYVEEEGVQEGALAKHPRFIEIQKLEAIANRRNPVQSSERSKMGQNADIIEGGDGQDFLYGDGGNDILYGEVSNALEQIATAVTRAGTFDDPTVSVAEHNDVLIGGDGNDTLYGNWGNDTLYGDDAFGVSASSRTASNTYNGSRYVLTEAPMTWTAAQAYAEQLGGHLVTVNTADEAKWLRQTFGPSDHVWIGLNNERVDGKFEWSRGGTVPYTRFASGKSNHFGRKNYFGRKWNRNDQWNDINAGYTRRGLIEINHEAGDDVLFGNSGNDSLYGEEGDDVLNGSSFQALGAYEQDVLVGGEGRDRFILGSAAQAFYSAAENSDYALIKDFNAVDDKIQLHGTVSHYSQNRQDGNIFLYQNETSDLVAVFENLSTTLNLNAVAHFV